VKFYEPDRSIVLSWQEGAVDQLLERFMESRDWWATVGYRRVFTPQAPQIDLVALRQIHYGAFDAVGAVFAEVEKPRWPHWAPLSEGVTISDDEREALYERVYEILSPFMGAPDIIAVREEGQWIKGFPFEPGLAQKLVEKYTRPRAKEWIEIRPQSM
jgi:hypothetical protein